MDKKCVSMVRDLAEKEIAARDPWMDRNGFDKYTYDILRSAGLYGLTLQGQYGGSEADTGTAMAVIRALAAASASTAFSLAAHWLAAGIVENCGDDKQKAEYLPQAAAGKIFAFGLTEESAGSDAAGICSTAVETSDGWVINGGKLWITNSGVADYYIILAKTDARLGTRGISAFIVPKNAPGLRVGEFERKMGMRGATTCKLYFSNMLLHRDALIGTAGCGFKYAMSALDSARISIAYQALGISDHALEIAFHHANSRKTFGSYLSEHQAIQFSAAEMQVRITAGTLLADNAVRAKCAGSRCTSKAAMAKLYCSEACSYSCNKAIQFLGGNGYSEEFQAERLVRDARVLEIAEGTSEILRMIIGREAMKGFGEQNEHCDARCPRK